MVSLTKPANGKAKNSLESPIAECVHDNPDQSASNSLLGAMTGEQAAEDQCPPK